MRWIALLIATLWCSTVVGREVDNYMAWGVDLEDSGPKIDQYIREHLADSLNVVNDSKYTNQATGKVPHQEREDVIVSWFGDCYRIAHDVMREAFYNPTYQKIEEHVDHAEGLDRYPRRPSSKDNDVRVSRGETPERGYMDNKEYLKESIVITSPLNTPLSRIVNVYGVYAGSDKFGHFTSFGVRYLAKFRELIDTGMTKEEAFDRVMDAGYQTEDGIVGMAFTKVFSRGDLEANFQGMYFAWSLCQPDSAVRLHYNGDLWEWRGLDEFTLKQYANPNWDESFHNSLFTEKKWEKQVTPTFERRNDCDKLESDWVIKQRAAYKKNVEESLSTLHGDTWFPENFKDMNPEDHSLDAYCRNRPAKLSAIE